MYERQVMAVSVMLFFSVIFINESFAQVQQCNGLDATHVGTNDRDIILGTSGDDVIVALGGNDIIYAKGGNDIICGGAGNDRIFGNSGNDVLIGNSGSDRLYGGNGIDSCDSSLEDKIVTSCETQYEKSTTNDGNDLQKQIADLQTQINNIVFRVIHWDDIQGVPESLADGDDDMLSKIECNTEQIILFNGEEWVCSDIPGINTSDTLAELNCESGQIIRKNGENWECSIEEKNSSEQINDKASGTIFFHHGILANGQTEWVGASIQVFDAAEMDKASMVMPTSGTLSNLIAKTGISLATSPGLGESYKLTILVNGQEPTSSLSCTIADDAELCSDNLNQVFLNEGDSIVLQIEASNDAPFAVISTSALLTY